MLEKDFLDIYKKRFTIILNNYYNTLENNKYLPFIQFQEKYIDFGGAISQEGNILILTILEENNINPNQEVTQELYVDKISGILLRKSFSIQLECEKEYSKKVEKLLNQVYLQSLQ